MGICVDLDEGDGGYAREVSRHMSHRFFIESEERVDEIHRRLQEDGFDGPPPENTGHSYGFYVKAPGGFMVEVGA